ncbi:MAG TPA: hypothetical protein PLV57_19555 [Phycisphaerae bacterium]|nr:hypothetical protein [Phycisphaerae bacterium]HPP28709.1 hypothetical protein [Phycisphaerae bacterium]
MRTYSIQHAVVLSLAPIVVVSLCQKADAQMRPPRFIHADAVWSGTVVIEHDVEILSAEVRVEPGTTIRFSGGRGAKGPVLRLSSSLFAGSERSRPSRLVLNGTPDRPIVVESAEAATPGAIVAAPGTTTVVNARHVIFRRLGPQMGEHTVEPALSVHPIAPEDDLWLTDCRFEDCGSVRAEFVGADAGCEIVRCTFARTRGPVAIRLMGLGTGIKVVQGNVADAAIEVACPQTVIGGNVLVGEMASIVVRKQAGAAVTVAGNYVHCTTDKDIGRYAAKCEAPDARLMDNVLAGGTYVIETTPRTAQRNVVIGAGHLEAELGVDKDGKRLPAISAMTHALMTNISPGAVISDNLLLGPAYVSVSVEQTAGFSMKDNYFDGWGVARQAVRFETTATGPAEVVFTGNTVVDFSQVPIVNEARGPGVNLQARGNTFVGFAGPVWKGFAGLRDGADDRRVASAAELNPPVAAGRGSPTTQAAADVDELLVTGRKTPAQVHRMWFEMYGKK